jgi:hypothetical protein
MNKYIYSKRFKFDAADDAQARQIANAFNALVQELEKDASEELPNCSVDVKLQRVGTSVCPVKVEL